MTSPEPTTLPVLSRRERRRLLLVALTRSAVVAGTLLALYYLLPLDRILDLDLPWILAGALVLLGLVISLEVRLILRSHRPGVQAIEALATTIPFFLLVFSAVYYVLSGSDSTSFSQGALSRTDAIYFTVTVFATVGFGDITPTTQATRALVTVQMLLDLIVLGLVIRVFFGAVQTAWKREHGTADVSTAVVAAERAAEGEEA